MSPLFGKKNKPSTIAILDIESGSVGSALVELTGSRPRLFAQERVALLDRSAPSAERMLKEIERELEQALVRLSHVSARMRGHGTPTELERMAVFLHAPWVGTQSVFEKVLPKPHDATLEQLRHATKPLGVPVTFHAFSTTTTPIVHSVFSEPEEALVCIIGAEVAELVLLNRGVIAGHASVPGGMHTLLRTLESHAGVSRAEALSILTLSSHHTEHQWAEALAAGVAQLTKQMHSAAEEIMPSYKTAKQIFVIGPEKSTPFLARSLTSESSMHELFAPGSTVRAVLPRHITPHLLGHPATPDVPLLLESLFVDTRFGV